MIYECKYWQNQMYKASPQTFKGGKYAQYKFIEFIIINHNLLNVLFHFKKL